MHSPPKSAGTDVAAPRCVDWSPRALRDLIAIFRHTVTENPHAAAEQTEYLIRRAEALARSPRLGRLSRWPGRRELVLTRYPYSIYYRVTGKRAYVLRVVHQRRLFP